MTFLVTGMNLVAGNAGPPFFPVDVEIVEVSIPIAEIGQSDGLLLHHQCLLVALETKGVKFRVIRIIKLLNIIIFQ